MSDLESQEGRFDWIRRQVEGPDDRIRQTLLHAGVPYQDFDQPVCQLSGGEKARMQFAVFRLQAPNFLILDEPTNHIDLEGREALIDALIETGITLIVTSHDRDFLNACVTQWWLIDQGKIAVTHDPEAFYRGVFQQATAAKSQRLDKPTQGIAPGMLPSDGQDETAWLMEIETLEELLEADLKRKPKHQLKDRHDLWRQQIAALWLKVEG